MDRDTIFLYVIAVIASCFGLINCIQFFLKGNKTAQTVGTIISFKTINPENSKFRNSKWATVSYKVNGRTYQSQNCIQVPMASIEIMPHFPGWFVAICVLLPVSNVIYKTWKNNKKK